MTTVAVKDLKPAASNRTVEVDSALKELAQSIATAGLIEPMVGRPVDGHVEVVVGHRRLAAIKLAGLKEIPTDWLRVKEMSDGEAEVMRVAENLHRADLHPVDELRGYEALATLSMNVVEIAAAVGKPIQYVQRRMALTTLEEPMRDAFRRGKIGMEVAYLVARLPGEQDRKRAFKHAMGEHGYRPSADDVARWIQRSIYCRLAGVPWGLDDAALVPTAGACTVCPKRRGNQGMLFDTQEQIEADTCLDPACFREKMAAVTKAKIADIRKAGAVVLDEKAAKAKAQKGKLSNQPTQLDVPEHNGGGENYVSRLGPLHQAHCLAGCPNFAYVKKDDGSLTKACFDSKCLQALLRKAERSAEPETAAKGGKPSKAERQHHDAQRATSIQRRLRPLVDAWLVQAVTPALGKSLDMERRLSLVAACDALSRQTFDVVSRAKDALKPFNPLTEYRDATRLWKRVLDLESKQVPKLLHTLLATLCPAWDPKVLPAVAGAVGVVPKKTMALTEAMAEVFTNTELEDVATELKLTSVMAGDKKGEKVASLLPHCKPGKLPKVVVKVLEGANP